MKTTMTKLAPFVVVLTGVVAMSGYLGTSQAVPIEEPPANCDVCPLTLENSEQVCDLLQCSSPCRYICRSNGPTRR